MNTKNTSIFWAVAFLVAGVAGFVPNPLVGQGALFETNLAHNMVHVVTAIAFAFFMTKTSAVQILFMKVFGIVYLGVGILGFIWLGGGSQGMLLGFIQINSMDNFLHLGLGTGIAVSGWVLGNKFTARG